MSEAGQARLRVLIADDNAVLRMGLGLLLSADPGIDLVGEASSGEEAMELAAELHPDVVLLDVRMPGSHDGISAAISLVETTVVVMLTYSDDPIVVRAALKAGVRGYLVHGDVRPGEIVDAVKDAVSGRTVLSPRVSQLLVQHLVQEPSPEDERRGGRAQQPSGEVSLRMALTPREREIMELLAHGLDNDDIAKRLFITRNTLKNHITRVFAKLGVTSRSQAVAYWLREHGPRTPISEDRGRDPSASGG
jgi:DNA-binding NarL/FixJ family response regulator